jgi:D-alanine-D-alanine ligase
MKITVLLGGTSAERDVSLASGLRIVDALRSRGHQVTPFDPARGLITADQERELRGGRVVQTAPPDPETLRSLEQGSFIPSLGAQPEIREADVVFLALHGGMGEDGTIQAMLDMVGATYTGSGHLASALAMDKDLSKHLFRAAGVPTADWLMAPASEEEVAEAVGFPAIVKPSKQGSTVGLTLVRDPSKLREAVDEAFRHDDEVMIERFVPGRELTVTVIGDEALPVGEIKAKHEIYDYECKYTVGMATEEFPADLTAAQTGEVQSLGLAAFRALKLDGYARIDFRMTPEGEFSCLEANTLPGMTETSLVPQAAQAAGMSFETLCERIAQEARTLRDTLHAARDAG